MEQIVGRVALVHRGDWDAEFQYEPLDMARLGPDSHLCIARNRNESPPGSSSWVLSAAGGLKGPTGDQGPPGVDGVNGVGVKGPPGDDGVAVRGDRGPPGVRGLQGIQGVLTPVQQVRNVTTGSGRWVRNALISLSTDKTTLTLTVILG